MFNPFTAILAYVHSLSGSTSAKVLHIISEALMPVACVAVLAFLMLLGIALNIPM